uniref:Programmed cell death protein 4-like n=1 Tax=Cucumis sativus TaxID=3659 RepID=A0A0A0LWP4_CUCSA
MKKSEKSSKPSGKSEVRKDRKSATGMNGSPKKGGHGGKFTWSGDGYSPAEIGFKAEVMDVKDPNFEDLEEAETVAVAV